MKRLSFENRGLMPLLRWLWSFLISVFYLRNQRKGEAVAANNPEMSESNVC